MKDDALFVGQLFVDSALPTARHWDGGSQRLDRRSSENRPGGHAPGGKDQSRPGLYERLGFRTTHEDERKFYRRRE
jgi:hypothetical protein